MPWCSMDRSMPVAPGSGPEMPWRPSCRRRLDERDRHPPRPADRRLPGDFYCWIRSPGQSTRTRQPRDRRGDGRSDLLVLLTPRDVRGPLVRAEEGARPPDPDPEAGVCADRGETQHQKRYARYPDSSPSAGSTARAAAEAVLPRSSGGTPSTSMQPLDGARVASSAMTGDAIQGQSWPTGSGESPIGIAWHRPCRPCAQGTPATGPRRAQAPVLPVGSPRPGRAPRPARLRPWPAASRSGASRSRPSSCTRSRAPPSLRAVRSTWSRPRTSWCSRQPLYVDTLPAPVLRSSSGWRFAARSRPRCSPPGPRRCSRRAMFSALVNCGFPEAAHIAPALAVSAQFAAEAGFAWAGGLALAGVKGSSMAPRSTPWDGPARFEPPSISRPRRWRAAQPSRQKPTSTWPSPSCIRSCIGRSAASAGGCRRGAGAWRARWTAGRMRSRLDPPAARRPPPGRVARGP